MNSTTAPPTTPPRPPGVAEPSGFAASAAALYEDLVADGATSHVGTPCGILAPLWTQAENDPRVTLTTISREDTALAFAAGQALAGGRPVVMMQNSGFGSCVNVMASLVCAFELSVTLVVSLRGTGVDHTAENRGMGAVTRTLLDAWRVPCVALDEPGSRAPLHRLDRVGPRAVLVGPSYFGWRP